MTERHGGPYERSGFDRTEVRPQFPDLILSIRRRGRGRKEILASRLISDGSDGDTRYIDRSLGILDRSDVPDVERLCDRFYRSFSVAASVREIYLEALGYELWSCLPAEFHAFFVSTLASKAGEWSILAIDEADAVPFPWELVRPPRRLQAYTPEFMGIAFSIGHWIAGLALPEPVQVNDAALLTPVSEQQVETGLDLVSSSGAGLTSLPTGSPEFLDHILALKGAFPDLFEYLVARISNLEGLLNPPLEAQLIHIACHGTIENDEPRLNFNPEGNGAGTAFLIPALLELLADPPTSNMRPFVFLNACEAGQTPEESRNYMADGWFQAFTGIGSAGVVAPLWTVQTGISRDIAGQFYAELAAGETAGRALQAIRRKFRNFGGFMSPDEERYRATWLAYVLFGDPNHRIHLNIPDHDR